ncbi:MAG: SDR family oxidoreductase [Blastocatellia bacterium]
MLSFRNQVASGWIDAEMAASVLHVSQERFPHISAAIPLGRVATAEDIADPIMFLASSLARHITGENLNVNGSSVLCG